MKVSGPEWLLSLIADEQRLVNDRVAMGGPPLPWLVPPSTPVGHGTMAEILEDVNSVRKSVGLLIRDNQVEEAYQLVSAYWERPTSFRQVVYDFYVDCSLFTERNQQAFEAMIVNVSIRTDLDEWRLLRLCASAAAVGKGSPDQMKYCTDAMRSNFKESPWNRLGCPAFASQRLTSYAAIGTSNVICAQAYFELAVRIEPEDVRLRQLLVVSYALVRKFAEVKRICLEMVERLDGKPEQEFFLSYLRLLEGTPDRPVLPGKEPKPSLERL